MFDTHDAVISYLRAVIPEITDIADEYGEPGYGPFLSDPGPMHMVVLGYYWCECDKFGDSMHAIEKHYPATFARLAELGVELEWYDEWVVDYNRHVGKYPNIRIVSKAYRSKGNSYSWQPSAVDTEGGELLTIDDDIETWIEWAANDPSRAIPSNVYTGQDLLNTAGFTKFNGVFESGFHAGQNDDPANIIETIHTEHGDVTVVFAIDDIGQFDMQFSAYFRPEGEETD